MQREEILYDKGPPRSDNDLQEMLSETEKSAPAEKGAGNKPCIFTGGLLQQCVLRILDDTEMSLRC